MQLSLQLSILQGTTSYFDGNVGRVGVKSDTVGRGLFAVGLVLLLRLGLRQYLDSILYWSFRHGISNYIRNMTPMQKQKPFGVIAAKDSIILVSRMDLY